MFDQSSIVGGDRSPATDPSPSWPLIAAVLVLAVALAGCAQSTEEPLEREAEVVIAFDEADDEREPLQRSVSYDPDTRPAMQVYEGVDADRPDSYTVHDLLVDLEEQSEVSLTIEHREGLGFQLVEVDGLPSEDDAFWALYVDGQRETAGIGTVEVEDGASYEWRLHERTSPTEEDEDLSKAYVIVDYNGFRDEDPQRTEDVITFDPAERPTMPRYEDGPDRPDAYILHDLISDWSNQTGTDHVVREDEQTGYRLTTLDGVTGHSTQGGKWTWELTVDGEAETAGLSTVQVEPGSTYEWRFERSSGGGSR